jgi:hypothetical protein
MLQCLSFLGRRYFISGLFPQGFALEPAFSGKFLGRSHFCPKSNALGFCEAESSNPLPPAVAGWIRRTPIAAIL